MTARSGWLVVAATLLAACGGREERSLNAYGTLTLERGTAQVDVLMQGRIHDVHFPQGQFDDAWAAVTRGAAPWDALMITAINTVLEPRGETDLTVALILAAPLPLVRGASYDIGAAFAPPAGMPLYWNAWGRRELARDGVGEVALRVFDYRPVGMEILNDFVATAATGTIEVTTATRDQVILRLDISATNAGGETVRLYGDLDLRGERYTPPIT